MLLESEEKYLQKIPEDKVVVIKPFDPALLRIAEKIINKVKQLAPNLRVIHMGASGLGISGQGDLDIYALSDPDNFPSYLDPLKRVFGEPRTQKADSVEWEFEKEGYLVELYLTDPSSPSMRRQIAVFEKLKSDKALLDEYEKLKESMNGQSFREYQGKKYEFYHRILGD